MPDRPLSAVLEDRRRLMQEMADLTQPLCEKCGRPEGRMKFTCCSPEYCWMAADIMAEEGVPIPADTSHPTLRFMGPTGCIVSPQFRPLCTLHVCSINSLGTTGNRELDQRYFQLRGQIEEILGELDRLRRS